MPGDVGKDRPGEPDVVMAASGGFHRLREDHARPMFMTKLT